MGLKGYRLWVMGQLDSTRRAPPRRKVGTFHKLYFPVETSLDDSRYGVHGTNLTPGSDTPYRGVALQVAFERQTLKPDFHLIGYRLWV
jgi:hypothetical protein